MSDDNNIQFDPHQHQTVYLPPAQTDIFTILRNNTGSLAWIAAALFAFWGIATAWERKASKTQLEKAHARILKLEKEIVSIRAELKFRKFRRRRP